jgi:erythromycin esterase
MAENVIWWLNYLGPDSKIVLWAHNGHVAKGDPAECQSCIGLGYFLSQALGPEYAVLGFAFDQGGFQAIPVMGDVWGDIGPQTLPQAPAGSLTWHLRQAGLQYAILPINDHAPEATWLQEPLQLWDVGSAVWMDSLEDNLVEACIPSLFDLIIYIENTTPARPLW